MFSLTRVMTRSLHYTVLRVGAREEPGVKRRERWVPGKLINTVTSMFWAAPAQTTNNQHNNVLLPLSVSVLTPQCPRSMSWVVTESGLLRPWAMTRPRRCWRIAGSRSPTSPSTSSSLTSSTSCPRTQCSANLSPGCSSRIAGECWIHFWHVSDIIH